MNDPYNVFIGVVGRGVTVAEQLRMFLSGEIRSYRFFMDPRDRHVYDKAGNCYNSLAEAKNSKEDK